MAGERDQGVTLALIDAKLDTVIEKLADMRRDVDNHATRIRELERSDTRQNERLGMLAAVLGIFQLISSTIAAWIGVNR